MRSYAFAAGAALVWAMASQAAAETPLNELPVLVGPQSVGSAPEPRFPEAARRAGFSGGSASVACRVTTAGDLRDCAIVAESQPGLGFGPAAAEAAARTHLRPMMQGGRPVEARVTLPFQFARLSQYDQRFVLADVPWAAAPGADEVAQAAPRGAGAGDAVLDCEVRPGGQLQRCRTLSESGAGFGEAARRLAGAFRVDMDQVDPTVSDILWVRAPVHFPGPGAAPAPPIVDPVWTRSPAASVLHDSFPGKAADAGLTTGRAVLDCVAGEGGAMTECQVLDETPAGMDFGPAALRVATAMTVALWTTDGRPTQDRHVKFAVRLNRQEDSGASGR